MRALRGFTLLALEVLLGVWWTGGFFASASAVKPQARDNANANVRSRMLTSSYCAARENHKYIFRKLTAVKSMQNQEATFQSFSVGEFSRRGSPAR